MVSLLVRVDVVAAVCVGCGVDAANSCVAVDNAFVSIVVIDVGSGASAGSLAGGSVNSTLRFRFNPVGRGIGIVGTVRRAAKIASSGIAN